jgi:hypothetical protein
MYVIYCLAVIVVCMFFAVEIREDVFIEREIFRIKCENNGGYVIDLESYNRKVTCVSKELFVDVEK